MKTATLITLLAIAGCASQEQESRQQQVGQAVVTPLSDLNLVKAQIPDVLKTAYRAPYALPADSTCLGLAGEISALDAVLGADLDTPQTEKNPSLLERGTGAAGDAAVGFLRSTAENVVPFRGWIRKLTGAEKYSKEVAASITAGGIRRAFLKGIRASKDCTAA